MTSNLLYLLIKTIIIEVYVDVEGQGECSSTQLEHELKQLEEYLHDISVKYKIYYFKRYDVKDYIDDEVLCENYLSFSALFEEAPAPTIVMKLILNNNCMEAIKISNDEIVKNHDELFDYLLLSITRFISSFSN